jgi:hypothetical protein
LAYLAVLTVAILLRFISLGNPALSDGEARQAFAAWHLLSPETAGTGEITSPLAFAGAVFSFALAGATNAAARFVPMLGGIGLVLSPLLFRRRLGRLATLLTVLFLALSPTAVAASRRLDGAGMAMLALVLALAVFDAYNTTRSRQSALLAGMMLGAALLADYGSLVVLITMLLGVGFALLTDDEGHSAGAGLRDLVHQFPWGPMVVSLAGTVVLLGTLFFLYPAGLGAVADQLARFVNGLVRPTADVTFVGLVLALYEPVLILFGIVGAWLASQSSESWQRFLAGWGAAALLISLIYRGALPQHSLWTVIPMAALAAVTTTRLLDTPHRQHEGPRWAVWAHAVGVVALIAMITTNVSQYLRAPRMLVWPPTAGLQQATVQIPSNLILAGLWLVLLVVLWLTIAGIWGGRPAWRGLGLGVLLIGLLASTGQSGALAFTRATSPFEPANYEPAQPALDRLVQVAEQIGNFAIGHPHDVSLTVQAAPDGALAWALRDFTNLAFVERVDPTVDSVIVIAPAEESTPALGSNYVGQDFVIVRHWSPAGMSGRQVVAWMFYREAGTPVAETRVVLWVREDVYQLVQAGGTLWR